MTKKSTNKQHIDSSKDFLRLSIQIGLNGLSFCILDTLHTEIISSEHRTFAETLDPFQVLKELKNLMEAEGITKTAFAEVVAVHRNTLFGLVPKALFKENELPNYLQFNAKILANDHITHDELEGYDIVNTYVPFVNINNYLYELFGEFTFKHHATVLVQTLLNEHKGAKRPVVYANAYQKELDITIISQKKLLLFNSTSFDTADDFLYHLLFTMEQLELDTEQTPVYLLGDIREKDALYAKCYEYISKLSIFIPATTSFAGGATATETMDLTLLNAL